MQCLKYYELHTGRNALIGLVTDLPARQESSHRAGAFALAGTSLEAGLLCVSLLGHGSVLTS